MAAGRSRGASGSQRRWVSDCWERANGLVALGRFSETAPCGQQPPMRREAAGRPPSTSRRSGRRESTGDLLRKRANNISEMAPRLYSIYHHRLGVTGRNPHLKVRRVSGASSATSAPFLVRVGTPPSNIPFKVAFGARSQIRLASTRGVCFEAKTSPRVR